MEAVKDYEGTASEAKYGPFRDELNFAEIAR